mmetsp:Transcript_37368/g.54697  ORF Transcript_37368/g.54697 Transcript_37368/m.54697 type:complete len:153 (-) Transcript_37368:829-1287(-)
MSAKMASFSRSPGRQAKHFPCAPVERPRPLLLGKTCLLHGLDGADENRSDLFPPEGRVRPPKDLVGHPCLLHLLHQLLPPGVLHRAVRMLREEGRYGQVHVGVLPGHGDALVGKLEIMVAGTGGGQELVSAVQEGKRHVGVLDNLPLKEPGG